MNRDVARVDCPPIRQSGYRKHIKSCLRYGGARFVYVLNTNTALLNISFRSGGSSPKYRSFVSVVKEKLSLSNITIAVPDS